MRRPKAAIPILPPPDNQQTVRGRGRSTQQYQQNNQSAGGGNIQQTEKEIKIGNTVESDEKSVPGQFDSVQIEQLNTPSQESPKNQALDMVRIANEADEMIETNINIDASKKDAAAIQDNIDDSVSVKELLEATSNEKNTVSHSPTTLAAETERELGNIETAIPESTIVEEAAA